MSTNLNVRPPILVVPPIQQDLSKLEQDVAKVIVDVMKDGLATLLGDLEKLLGGQPLPTPAPSPAPAPAPTAGPLALASDEAQRAISASESKLRNQMNGGITGMGTAGLKPKAAQREQDGSTDVLYDRLQDGIRVFGVHVAAHVDSNGNLAGVHGDMNPLPFAPDARTTPTVDADQALSIAEGEFANDAEGLQPDAQPQSELVYFHAKDGTFHKAYFVQINNVTSGEMPYRMRYMIDAHSGEVLAGSNVFVEPPAAPAAPSVQWQ